MSELPPLSLYIHIPWCVKKCPYCDFNSHVFAGALPDLAYVDHLLADLEADLSLSHHRPVSTIFIGGGTPSLLSAAAMERLMEGIRARVELLPAAEITMEANPGSVEVERFAAFQAAGINRLSIGVQSFNADKLLRLGRIHGPQEALAAAHTARTLPFTSFNLDLMHGLPQQSEEEALADICQAIALRPTHLSWYQLTIEPNTLFHSQPPRLPDEETLWQINEQGERQLAQAGYQQYEISAYAQPGYRCQHNLNYWRFGDYLAIGCGAHSKLTRRDGTIIRQVKTRHPQGYLRGEYLFSTREVTLDERPFEFFLNRFRLLEATPRQDFSALTAVAEGRIRPQIEAALQAGYLLETPQAWQVTRHGRLFLNSLLQLFI